MEGIKLTWRVTQNVKVSAMYCFKRCDYRQN